MLRRLAFIRAARTVGVGLEEVRAGLDQLPDGRTPNRSDWTRLSRSWRGRLNEQIDALVALRDGLDSCIGCGCLSLQRCQLSNPRDIAARSSDAPGAVYLPAALRRPAPAVAGVGRLGGASLAAGSVDSVVGRLLGRPVSSAVEPPAAW